MINIFDKHIITDPEIVEFWTKNVVDQGLKEHRNKNYIFSKTQKELLIHAKDDNVVLNPERDFIQARVDLSSINSKKEIIVEPRVFIERLYMGLAFGFLLFFLLNLKNSVLFSIGLLTVFTLIGYYNYRKINTAVLTFKNELEDSKED